MQMHFFNWKWCLAAGLGTSLLAVCSGHAQQSSQRTGGGGGFNRNTGSGQSSGSAAATQYNTNGSVGNATISIDPDTHNVTIIADEETTKYIAQVITSLDQPQPQVLIKVVFVQITHTDALDLGVEGGWKKHLSGSASSLGTDGFGLSPLSSAATSTTPATNVFGLPIQSFQQIAPFAAGPGAGLYQILGDDFQATLRMIAAAGKAEVLSRPSILARNNQPASVVVGQYVPLITSVSYNTISGAPINSVSYTDVGIILTVTPYITSDGLVQMIIAPQTSSIDPNTTVSIAQGVNAPVINTISANTVAVTPNGQTVVIGGLMQRTKSANETKIPLLGDIPLLGHLFKRTTTATAKQELLIFLTPYVIQAPSQLAAMSTYERGNSLVPKSYSEEELDKLLDKLPTKPLKGTSPSAPDSH